MTKPIEGREEAGGEEEQRERGERRVNGH